MWCYWCWWHRLQWLHSSIFITGNEHLGDSSWVNYYSDTFWFRSFVYTWNILAALLYICIFVFLLGNCNNYFINRYFLLWISMLGFFLICTEQECDEKRKGNPAYYAVTWALSKLDSRFWAFFKFKILFNSDSSLHQILNPNGRWVSIFSPWPFLILLSFHS